MYVTKFQLSYSDDCKKFIAYTEDGKTKVLYIVIHFRIAVNIHSVTFINTIKSRTLCILVSLWQMIYSFSFLNKD